MGFLVPFLRQSLLEGSPGDVRSLVPFSPCLCRVQRSSRRNTSTQGTLKWTNLDPGPDTSNDRPSSFSQTFDAVTDASVRRFPHLVLTGMRRTHTGTSVSPRIPVLGTSSSRDSSVRYPSVSLLRDKTSRSNPTGMQLYGGTRRFDLERTMTTPFF